MADRSSSATHLRYMVVVPVPYRDRNGRVLPARMRRAWQAKTQTLLTRCFGGATPIPSVGYNLVQTRKPGGCRLLKEDGQVIVIACCKDKAEYRRHKAKIKQWVDRMCRALDQYAGILIAGPADSILTIYPEPK